MWWELYICQCCLTMISQMLWDYRLLVSVLRNFHLWKFSAITIYYYHTISVYDDILLLLYTFIPRERRGCWVTHNDHHHHYWELLYYYYYYMVLWLYTIMLWLLRHYVFTTYTILSDIHLWERGECWVSYHYHHHHHHYYYYCWWFMTLVIMIWVR